MDIYVRMYDNGEEAHGRADQLLRPKRQRPPVRLQAPHTCPTGNPFAPRSRHRRRSTTPNTRKRKRTERNEKTDGVPGLTETRPSLVSKLRRHHRLDVPEPVGHVPAWVGQGQGPHVGPAVACLDYQSRGLHCIHPPWHGAGPEYEAVELGLGAVPELVQEQDRPDDVALTENIEKEFCLNSLKLSGRKCTHRNPRPFETADATLI